MDQKNSESLIKWNAADEWQVQCCNSPADCIAVEQHTGQLFIRCERLNGTGTTHADVALDKPSAQALVAKMQELIEGMK